MMEDLESNRGIPMSNGEIRYYTCSFCGYNDTILGFVIKKRNGLYSRKLFRCKDCKTVMYRGTLMTRMTIKYWGAWISINTRLYGHKFSERVQWEKLRNRLQLYKIEKEFWFGYNFVRNNFERLTDKQRVQLSTLDTPDTTQTKLVI